MDKRNLELGDWERRWLTRVRLLFSPCQGLSRKRDKDTGSQRVRDTGTLLSIIPSCSVGLIYWTGCRNSYQSPFKMPNPILRKVVLLSSPEMPSGPQSDVLGLQHRPSLHRGPPPAVQRPERKRMRGHRE